MAELQVIDLAEGFGAEIRGLEPSIQLDEEIRLRLRDVFDDRGVVVLRDLDIDQRFQKYLAHLLIGIELPSEELEQEIAGAKDRVTHVSNRETGGAAPYGRLLFHSDTMWSDNPCLAISLYAVEVEPPAVPTQFVSTARGWDTLPADLRARVEGLHALQGHDRTYPNRGGDDDVIDAVFEEPKKTTTLVGRRHPRTGRTLLYVSQQVTQEIVELSPEENEEVLEALFAHLYDSTNVYTHEWRQGDLIIWDNLAIQHARPNVSLDGPARTLRKVFAPPHDPISSKGLPTFSKAG
jgi:taurine dioxygenase